MISETINIIKLVASDGMTLTNGKAYGKEIYLGKNDTADNWYEITDKEAAEKEGELEDVLS